MGQKNKLCSSNKVDNIYSIECITIWSPNIRRQLGAYTAEDGMEKCVEGRGDTKLSQ